MSVQSTFKTAKNTVTVLGSVLIPLIFFQILWPYAEKYWRLLAGALSVASGILFTLYYFRVFTPSTIWNKIKAYFSEKELMTEYMANAFGKNEILGRSRNFLYIGTALLILGFYLLYTELILVLNYA